tara:strand:+ start:117 stop:1016 length:900 start_codon:yes stop_codon:yes gene_type:complete
MSFLFSSARTVPEEEYYELQEEYEQLKEENELFHEIIQRKDKELEGFKKEELENHLFLGQLLYTREDNVRVYLSECRRLIPNLVPWEYNRKIDDEHVSALQKIIPEKKFLEGFIDLLECNSELCVVNGQHRTKAMRNIMEEVDQFNYNLMVNVHPVESFDSKEANEIFLATNNTKNVELRDRPQTKLQNICNRLIDRYPKSITNNKTGKANLHRLDKKQLYNLIQFNDSCNNENNTEDYLFEKIVSLNLKLSNQSYEELFGSKRTSQRKGKSYDGAQKEGFYLGLKNDTQLAILFQTFI